MLKKIPRKANGRIDFKPKKHHGFSFFIMICGWLLPPLAVAIRFGIGKDFFINVFLTICGYIPGHGHNFFIQNVRDNNNRGRTPKWAKRYGLVDDSDDKRKAKKRAWVGRYNDETATRQMYDDEGNVYEYDRNHRFEDGDGPGRTRQRQSSSMSDEQFYGRESNGRASNSLRRSSSRASLASLRRRATNSTDGVDMLPGAGDAERRRAKSKSRARGLLGRGKDKSDRHARAEQVMGADAANNGDYLHRNPYDDDSVNSIDGIGMGGGRGSGASRSARHGNGAPLHSTYSDDFEGPENADDNVGKRYAARTNGSAHPSSAPPRPPAKDIMDDNHQF